MCLFSTPPIPLWPLKSSNPSTNFPLFAIGVWAIGVVLHLDAMLLPVEYLCVKATQTVRLIADCRRYQVRSQVPQAWKADGSRARTLGVCQRAVVASFGLS